MEIMHSKFLKLQTALLSVLLLFSVLLPQTALAAGGTTNAAAAQDTVTLVDPNTFNSWEKIQGTRSITQGRIWADKTVSENEIKFSPHSPLGESGQTVSKTAGSDFLVALSALSSTSSLTKPEPQPIDIVLVLDASGSMDEAMGGTTWENYDDTKRIDALKTAAKNFLAAAKKQNDEIEDPAKQIQVSIVKFAGDKSKKVGNDTYRDGMYIYNYSQIMRNLTLCNSTNLSTLNSVVDSIKPAGATRSDYGMELAQTALGNASARSNAKKVVIFFTDGKPTSHSDYNAKVAGGAINTAKTLKDSGTTIYTVGIFSGADSSNPPAMPGQDEKKLANRFMHAVSSNYPAASSSGNDWDGYTVSMGTRAENSNYYKTATKSTELNTVFQEIFTDVTSDPPVPTLVESSKNATESGYVTFEDPLGDYMTVTDFNAIAFSDKIYTAPTKETRGNVTTYTFNGTNMGNVAYPQNVDLNKIIITVTHDNNLQTGDKVKVEIPAALLPLRYYNIAEDKGGKVSMEITPTYPIHVFYSVSLKDAAKQQMESGVITDTALANYVATHTEDDGKAYFYSNLYTGTRTGTDAEGNPYTAGNTTASFVPAKTNSFYYYTEDTPLYEDKACTMPAKNVQPNTPYYYDMPYYQTDKVDANGSLEPQHAHIKVSFATQDEINDTLNKKDGVYYVPKGTLKGSYPQALDNQLGGKEPNITNTASRRIDFGWDNNYTIGRLYLGNNGKIGYNATGSLKITKKVAKADPSYSPDAGTQFDIKVVLEGNGANGTYTYTIDGNASDPHPFTSGNVITLKNGQTAEIEGLPAGCKYTVSEPTPPDGYTSNIDAPAGVIAAGKVQDTAPVVTVTNTYKPSDVTLSGSTSLAGEKILNGRAWLASDQFDFQLEAVDAKNTPMPEVSLIQLKQSEGTAAGTHVPFHFGDITYTKPGTYIYDINEIIPSNGIIGISYDSTIYRVTVTVTDDHKGHLTAAASMQNLSDKSTAELATFTNTFAANDETLVLEAIKQFVDKGGNALTQTSGQFNFKLDKSQVDEKNNQLPADHDPPMPASVNAASSALGRVTYVLNYDSTRDLAKTYYYQLSEVNEGLKNITYSNERYLIKVTFTVETEDGEAVLQAHPTYYKWDDAQKWVQLDHQDSESGMTFTNTFTGTTTAKLSIGKILEGRNWMDGDRFTFILTAKGNAPMPEGENTNKLTITNASPKEKDDERLGDFPEITFTQPGTYEYTISEEAVDPVKLPGFKNHPGDITATVTVTRNGNELTSTVSYKDAAGKVGDIYGYFTNTYSPDPYTVSTLVLFKASKTLEGRGWLPEENFTFVLTGDESNPVDTPMPDFCEAVANSSHTTVTLGNNADLTFTQPDTYTYYITEKEESTPGLIYDTSKYKVVVTVEDKDPDGGNSGKSGKLTGSVQYFKGTLGENGEYTFSDEPGANIAAFTNTYAAKSVTLNGEKNLSVTKKLVGREWGNEEAFTFEIAVAAGSAENTPLPSEKTLTLTKPTPDGDTATGHFGNITYTKAGNYSYTIREVRGTDNTAAITQWDDSVYTVNVTVQDNGAGELNITNFTVESDGSNYIGISFTNRYEADPNPTKTVTDESRNNIDNTLVSPGQKLTYTIHWVNNAVDATGKYTSAEITVTDTVPANTTFDSADNGGTWDKTDNKVTWKFNADPNTEGDVSFTVKVNENISGENGEINNSALVGNRTTNTTHNYLPGKTADKDANTTLKVGDELTYTIKYKNLEDAAATVTVTDAVPAGTEFVSAENGGVCKNGTVTWNIADVDSGKEGSVSFKVRVTIDAVVRSIENQAQVKIGDHNPVTTTKTENKNIEKPSPASVTLTACKTLISDVGNHTLAAGEFSFNLLENDGKDGEIVRTATNDAEGNVTFDALSLDTIGEYTYTICEVDGNVGYITYDGSRYTVTFSVYATKDGTLAATEPVYSLNSKTVDAAEFINHYTAELPAGTSFSLSATKTLTGRSIIDGEFFFTLEDEGGNIVATATSDAKGNIQFPAVGLKNVQAAYTALLAAAEPVQPAAEPTPAEDEQPVKIEDGEQAPLETAVAANSLEGTPAVVTDAEPETKLDVAPETDSETEPKTDPETEPETEPAPTVDTDAVQALLTRWYTIREYAQGKDGVTYDANTYMVRVQLADKEGQGTLIVDSIQFFAADGETPLDNSAVVFNNSYAAEGVDLTVTAQKQLTGRSMADGEFSFRLSCNDDPANEQTVTSDANGRIAFALHYDDKDGTGTQETHTYTVTEVRGDNDTITYDDTAYTFTVEVIDDGTGHLTTKVTQPEAMVFRNVYTPKATSITLAGNKVLNGRAQKAGEFTFELCDANGAVIATAANGENGYFAFPALSYDEAGEYTYTVREKDTGVGRVTYDKTVYSVTVQVQDEDGQLKADIILPASGLTFTNTYTPEPAQTPAPTPKPTTSPAPAATAAPTPAPARIPQTADSFPLALLIGLLAVSGGALAVLLTARKRGKK